MVRSGLTILKFPYLLVRHRKRPYTRLNKVTLCFCFGSSHQSLKVRELKCVPGDPVIMCPVLFKGSCSLLLLALALCSLLYIPSLSCKAVLRIFLAVLCYACRYGIVCPSSGLCGSIFIYYKRALRIYGYAYNLTWGGLKNGKNGGEPNRFCHFCLVVKKGHDDFGLAPLSLNCFGRFSLNSTLFIHSPCQTGSQPMSGR